MPAKEKHSTMFYVNFNKHTFYVYKSNVYGAHIKPKYAATDFISAGKLLSN
jgi:hypothetical protein